MLSSAFGTCCGETLIIGAGGGSDIVAAYALARLFQEEFPASSNIVYANIKSRLNKTAKAGLAEVNPGRPGVYRLIRPCQSIPAKAKLHGGILIDESIPRGYRQSPWVITLADKQEESDALVSWLSQSGFRRIISVDLGSDSLLKESGRDYRLMQVLRRVFQNNPNLNWYHCLVGPGCDGEFSAEAVAGIRETGAPWLQELRKTKEMDLPEIFWRTLESQSAGLGKKRTPKILLNARNSAKNIVEIPRHDKPMIPREWLSQLWVYAFVLRSVSP